MASRGTSVIARRAIRPSVTQAVRPASRAAVGFAVRDVAGSGGAFEIDEVAAEALVFGSSSPLRVSGPGVLPAHFVVLPHGGVLVAASASALCPAIVNGAPLPTAWTVLSVPSRIRAGSAAVDFFYLRDSGTVLVDQDVETTVAEHPSVALARTRVDSSVSRRHPMRVKTPLPLPLPPVRVSARVPAARPTFGVRDVLVAGFVYVRRSWERTAMSTRVLLGVVALLVIFLIAR